LFVTQGSFVKADRYYTISKKQKLWKAVCMPCICTENLREWFPCWIFIPAEKKLLIWPIWPEIPSLANPERCT